MKKGFALLGTVCVAVGVMAADKEIPEGLAVVGALGFSGSRGNSDALQLNASLDATYLEKPYELRTGLYGAYGEANADTSDPDRSRETDTQRADAYANLRRRLNGEFAYLNGTFSHDAISDVDYRFNLGPGFGRVLHESAAWNCSLEAGAGYLWEQIAGVSDNYMTLRLAADAEARLGESASAWLRSEYIPRADDFDVYLVSAEAGVQASVTEKVGLRVTLKDAYNSVPATGKKRNDATLITALTWSL